MKLKRLGCIDICKAKNRQLYVVYRATGNREVLAQSETLKTLRAARKNILSMWELFWKADILPVVRDCRTGKKLVMDTMKW